VPVISYRYWLRPKTHADVVDSLVPPIAMRKPLCLVAQVIAIPPLVGAGAAFIFVCSITANLAAWSARPQPCRIRLFGDGIIPALNDKRAAHSRPALI